MATNVEMKDWLRNRAEQEVNLRSSLVQSAGGTYRHTKRERKEVAAAVRADFQEKFGIGWLTILMWLPTIMQIVKAILDAMHGQAVE